MRMCACAHIYIYIYPCAPVNRFLMFVARVRVACVFACACVCVFVCVYFFAYTIQVHMRALVS